MSSGVAKLPYHDFKVDFKAPFCSFPKSDRLTFNFSSVRVILALE
jgi:hypothetical protein